MGTVTLEVLWKDSERIFCRQPADDGDQQRHFFLPPEDGADHRAIESAKRLARECELKEFLDSAWAVRPLEVVRERGRTMLAVEYSGGEPLDRLMGEPMEIGRFLR